MFAEAWAQKAPGELDGLPVNFLGKDHLLTKKRTSARPQDLADLDKLEGSPGALFKDMAWPGRALTYKIGQLKIRELRTRAQHHLGRLLRLSRPGPGYGCGRSFVAGAVVSRRKRAAFAKKTSSRSSADRNGASNMGGTARPIPAAQPVNSTPEPNMIRLAKPACFSARRYS
jgi:hypothetical protein